MIAFGEVSASRYKYKPGSSLDSKSMHVLAGPGVRFRDGYWNGMTTLGVFFEAGWGDYDADTSYYGGGVLGRYDWASGLHLDLAFRMGSVETKYKADWTQSNYNLDSIYMGGHVGLGYEVGLGEYDSVDFTGRALWTRVNGDDVTNSAGERISFSDSDSLRSQLGATYYHSFGSSLYAYAGAFWEYEFDGENRATVDSQRVEKTSLKGHSGVGKLGLEWKVTDNVSLGGNVFGAIGERRGGGGSVNVGIAF